MLGWEIIVTQHGCNATLARWRTSIVGLAWLESLVRANQAVDLGGNGYPNKYSISARVLFPLIANGAPSTRSPLVIGDGYVLPPDWSSRVELDVTRMSASLPDEKLLVEAWDQS